MMPPIPSTWRHRTLGTRHVIDRTLGNRVCFIAGRFPSRQVMSYHISTCSLEEWAAYVARAKQVSP
jgi:hypothetical protein